jgi:hypothetical protein
LTGEWISFIVQGPTGEKHIYDRELLDRIGIENRTGTGAKQISRRYRDEKKVKYALLTSRRILIPSFRLNQAFLLDKFITQILAKRPVLYQTIKFVYQKESTDFREVSKAMTQSSRIDLPLPLLLLMQGSEMFAQLLSQRHEATPVFYLDRPSIFLYKNSLELDPQGRILAQEGIDIVENALRVISMPGTTSANAEFHLLIGLGQAHLERALVKMWNYGRVDSLGEFEASGKAVGRVRVLNTADVFTEARRLGIRPIVLTSQSQQAVHTLQLSGEVTVRIRRELDRGYLVLGLRHNVTLHGASTAGWWRINLTSGHLMGVMETGEGGSDVEYLAQLAIHIATWWVNTAGCLSDWTLYNVSPDRADRVSVGKYVFCNVCGVISAFVLQPGLVLAETSTILKFLLAKPTVLQGLSLAAASACWIVGRFE